MSYGTLQYGDGLVVLISKLELKDGRIVLSGSTTDHGFMPQGDTVDWWWRGPDNNVILRYRSPNPLRGITVSKGCALTIVQAIELSQG